jgi:flavocytochrome c
MRIPISCALVAALTLPVGTDAMQQSPARAADLIVVGAGIAGLSAALEAAQQGRRVTVVEMWSIFGGHAVMSQGGLSIVGTPTQEAAGVADSPDRAFNDFITWGEDADTEWVRYYVDHSRSEIYDWLTTMGVTFDGVSQPAGNTVPRFHQTHDRGVGLVSPIYRECLKNSNITFRWNVKVTSLIIERGRVVGVRGRELRTGIVRQYRASAVVMATGGFQSNLEMVRNFWPRELPFPEKFLVGSGLNSTGSGHKVAEGAGAALVNTDHQWNYSTGLPDPRYPGLNRGLNSGNSTSIWVNASGRRFVNEHGSTKVTFPALLQQKPAMYWAVFDEPGRKFFTVQGSGFGNFATVERVVLKNPTLVKSGNTLDEIAALINVPATALRETVAHYNDLITTGTDTDFGRFTATDSPRPPKIEQGPFYAVQFFPLTRKSMGGVHIDRTCHVLDKDQKPIPGLYAAGEMTGFGGINGRAGLEGTFLGPSIVTGRMAGRTAAQEITTPVSTEIRKAASPAAAKPAPFPGTAYCQSCHALKIAIAKPRPGYSHFEKVHREVLNRQFECVQCHAELGRYKPYVHRIDRVAQVETCRVCHVVDRD